MSKRLPVIWDAEPHTIAKIAILKSYLHAWFRILGRTRPGETLLYVDGFAGPGSYTNHNEGSPLAALKAARDAIHFLGDNFVASSLHCAFIEAHKGRFKAMSDAVAPYKRYRPKLGITTICEPFVNGIQALKSSMPGPFRGEGPLFIFADPFGATGIPFTTLADCMRPDSAELLINLDADGIGRIFFADSNNRRDEQLTELFGGNSWPERLTAKGDMKRLSIQILNLYKDRLRILPGVRFVWSFCMRGRQDSVNYHLVFATKNRLGLEKMKEAMRKIDATGRFSFSDAHADQHNLFGANNIEIFADSLFRNFSGRDVSIEEINLYALTETPFLNGKQMLVFLAKRGRLQVKARSGEKIRAHTFPDEKIESVSFGEFAEIRKQTEFGY